MDRYKREWRDIAIIPFVDEAIIKAAYTKVLLPPARSHIIGCGRCTFERDRFDE
jgi:hypothetical protein